MCPVSCCVTKLFACVISCWVPCVVILLYCVILCHISSVSYCVMCHTVSYCVVCHVPYHKITCIMQVVRNASPYTTLHRVSSCANTDVCQESCASNIKCPSVSCVASQHDTKTPSPCFRERGVLRRPQRPCLCGTRIEHV